MAIAAAIGAFAYLLLSSILALPSGNLQIGAASFVGAAAGALIGGGIAFLLLGRSSDASHTCSIQRRNHRSNPSVIPC